MYILDLELIVSNAGLDKFAVPAPEPTPQSNLNLFLSKSWPLWSIAHNMHTYIYIYGDIHLYMYLCMYVGLRA